MTRLAGALLVPALLGVDAFREGLRGLGYAEGQTVLLGRGRVRHCAAELVRWGDWGQACVMAFSYRDPRTGELVTVEQAVRVGVGRSSAWTSRRGPAEILCWGMLRSGLAQLPRSRDWSADISTGYARCE
jgi:hypothetical protein